MKQCSHSYIEYYADEALKYRKFICLLCGGKRAIEKNTDIVSMWDTEEKIWKPIQ